MTMMGNTPPKYGDTGPKGMYFSTADPRAFGEYMKKQQELQDKINRGWRPEPLAGPKMPTAEDIAKMGPAPDPAAVREQGDPGGRIAQGTKDYFDAMTRNGTNPFTSTPTGIPNYSDQGGQARIWNNAQGTGIYDQMAGRNPDGSWGQSTTPLFSEYNPQAPGNPGGMINPQQGSAGWGGYSPATGKGPSAERMMKQQFGGQQVDSWKQSFPWMSERQQGQAPYPGQGGGSPTPMPGVYVPPGMGGPPPDRPGGAGPRQKPGERVGINPPANGGVYDIPVVGDIGDGNWKPPGQGGWWTTGSDNGLPVLHGGRPSGGQQAGRNPMQFAQGQWLAKQGVTGSQTR